MTDPYAVATNICSGSFSHNDVWCLLWQFWHPDLGRQSAALCFGPSAVEAQLLDTKILLSFCDVGYLVALAWFVVCTFTIDATSWLPLLFRLVAFSLFQLLWWILLMLFLLSTFAEFLSIHLRNASISCGNSMQLCHSSSVRTKSPLIPSSLSSVFLAYPFTSLCFPNVFNDCTLFTSFS